MTDVSYGLNLGHGQVLLGPAGVLVVARSMAFVERFGQRTRGRPTVEFSTVRQIIEAGAAQVRAEAFPYETGNFPPAAGVAASGRSVVDPIGVAEMAKLLGVTPQWARTLLRRGAFASGQLTSGTWLVDRDEVLASLAGQAGASTHPGTERGCRDSRRSWRQGAA